MSGLHSSSWGNVALSSGEDRGILFDRILKDIVDSVSEATGDFADKQTQILKGLLNIDQYKERQQLFETIAGMIGVINFRTRTLIRIIAELDEAVHESQDKQKELENRIREVFYTTLSDSDKQEFLKELTSDEKENLKDKGIDLNTYGALLYLEANKKGELSKGHIKRPERLLLGVFDQKDSDTLLNSGFALLSTVSAPLAGLFFLYKSAVHLHAAYNKRKEKEFNKRDMKSSDHFKAAASDFMVGSLLIGATAFALSNALVLGGFAFIAVTSLALDYFISPKDKSRGMLVVEALEKAGSYIPAYVPGALAAFGAYAGVSLVTSGIKSYYGRAESKVEKQHQNGEDLNKLIDAVGADSDKFKTIVNKVAAGRRPA